MNISSPAREARRGNFHTDSHKTLIKHCAFCISGPAREARRGNFLGHFAPNPGKPYEFKGFWVVAVPDFYS